MKNIFKKSNEIELFYYIGYIRENEIYISSSISEEYEDCYYSLLKFVERYDYSDIAHEIYIKKISEEEFNKIAKEINSYNCSYTKDKILRNNRSKEYNLNFEDGFCKMLQKKEKEYKIVILKKKEKEKGDKNEKEKGRKG